MAHRVLLSCPNMLATLDELVEVFAQHGLEYDVPEFTQQLTEPQLLGMIDRYHGWIAGDDHATAAVLQQATRLKVLSKWGVGTDNIDKQAAADLGIRVTNTPGVFGDEVADVAMGYVTLLHRHLHTIDREVRAGTWHKPLGRSLRGRRTVVLGLGSIGHQVVVRAVAAGMVVTGVDPDPAARGAALRAGATAATEDLDTALADAEVVVLCAPLVTATHHVLDNRRLRLAPSGLMVVNVSRGPLVDQGALVAALQDGQVASAALDVFEVEPLPPDDPLTGMDNVILGSHNGSNSLDAVRRVNLLAIDNLVAGLAEVDRPGTGSSAPPGTGSLAEADRPGAGS